MFSLLITLQISYKYDVILYYSTKYYYVMCYYVVIYTEDWISSLQFLFVNFVLVFYLLYKFF